MSFDYRTPHAARLQSEIRAAQADLLLRKHGVQAVNKSVIDSSRNVCVTLGNGETLDCSLAVLVGSGVLFYLQDPQEESAATDGA